MLCSVVFLVFALAQTEGLRCKSGVQFSISAEGVGPITSELSTVTCSGFGSQCLRVDFTATIQGRLTVPYVVGQCVPSGGCSSVTCSQITSRVRQQLQTSAVIHSCKTYCCSTNNCNAPAEGIFPTPVVTPSTTLPMVSGARRCQSGLQFFAEIPGSGPVQSRFTTVDCTGVGNECLRVDFQVRVSGLSVPYVVGQCVRNGRCSAVTCSQITSAFRSQIRSQQRFSSVSPRVESCATHCCSTDNCNAKKRSGNVKPENGNSELGRRTYNAKPGSGNIVVSSFWVLFFHTLVSMSLFTMVK